MSRDARAGLARSAGDATALAERSRWHGVVVPALGTAKPCTSVLAQRGAVVAALLEDHEPSAQARDPTPDLVVDGRRQGEVADGVEPVRIEPERDDDHRARDGCDGLERAIRRLQVVVVRGTGSQGDVEVLARAVTFAGLVGAT